mmetsp:Transcript_11664/g.37396  ORF Transcript_11664/g.37396 Transcript_11664/m.37396 type:complete len:105 (-) Transcript_11664:275-589(-)
MFAAGMRGTLLKTPVAQARAEVASRSARSASESDQVRRVVLAWASHANTMLGRSVQWLKAAGTAVVWRGDSLLVPRDESWPSQVRRVGWLGKDGASCVKHQMLV